MDRKRPVAGWRAASLAAALFAITLNFLQPLAHVALIRDGAPAAADVTWGAFCQPTAGEDGTQDSGPAAGIHQCCLGLVQAPALASPSTAFTLVEPLVAAFRFATATDALAPVGIRDGPSQPRGPPSLA